MAHRAGHQEDRERRRKEERREEEEVEEQQEEEKEEEGNRMKITAVPVTEQGEKAEPNADSTKECKE